MFKPGPLYNKRKKLASELKSIPVQTGDIVYSASAAVGPFGIPFGKLIQTFTKSPYSHATLILSEGDEIYAIDVSDWGTRKLRVIDWFDNWYETSFCVVRLRQRPPEILECIKSGIYAFLDDDPNYDFNFNDPEAFYCTEAVKTIYMNCGIDLSGAYTVKEIVPCWFLPLLYVGSWVTRLLTNTSMPLDVPISIVGNERRGMLASPLTEIIYKS